MAKGNRIFGWALVVLGCGLLSAGCGSSTTKTSNKTPHYDQEPTLDQLKQGWNTIKPGANTMCARGQPWEFFVRPGKVDKVIVEFQGGGGCWDYVTCTPGANIFVDHMRIPPAMSDESVATGLLDHSDPRNPFRDWTHVYVPYCTGDAHWGDADHEYTFMSKAYTVHHHGADNVKAVLDWMKRNIKGPTEILSTGSSAGSYGSIMWAPHLAHMYPDAKVTQMGDAGAGVLPADIVPKMKAVWNVAASFPDFIPGADLSKVNSLDDIYKLVAKGYPDMQLAQYSTDYDWNQVYWSGLMGDSKDPRVWSAGMRKNLADIAAAVPAFRSYIAPGWKHTVDEFPQFYTMQSGGVKLTDWMSGLLARTAKSVDCGQHCGGPQEESGSAGWECTQGATTTPGQLDTDLELPLRFLHYDPPTWAGASGLSISACASSDATCSSPLAKATTDPAGDVTLQLKGGSSGFDGEFLIKGPDTLERLIVRPAIRNPQHPMIGDAYSWGVPNATEMKQMAKEAGVAYDPSQGFVEVKVLDCNLSWRKDVTVDLDGKAPDAFAGPPSWVPSQAANISYMFVNVAPGKHTVNLSVPGSTTPISEDIDVDAGGFTSLAGLSPQTVEPM